MTNSMSCSDGLWCTRADALLGVEGIHVSAVTATASGLVLHVETGDDLAGCPDLTRANWLSDHRGGVSRPENRVGGGDVNPYLAAAALIAAAIQGMENELTLEPITTGNAYESDADRIPTSLRDSSALLATSEIARKSFGDEVVDHYVQAADVELKAFDSTDWERKRVFERL